MQIKPGDEKKLSKNVDGCTVAERLILMIETIRSQKNFKL